MRYIGSKLKLIDFIKEVIQKYCGENISDKVFCDLFAGTGVVGRSFSPLVKKVIANDLEFYSYIANKVGLEGYNKESVERIIKKLRTLEGDSNLPFAQAYADGGKKHRKFYTAENGAKIAAARQYLDLVEDILDEKDFRAALLSVIDGSDAVANTTSVYGAFLKEFKPSALAPVQFKLPKATEKEGQENEVYQENANELIKNIKGDILYLDPPYNTRQYSSNYHILNYVALNIAPETDSVAGVAEHNKSKYSSKANAASELEDLIKNADFEWIFLSYNNEGTISLKEIQNIFSKYGEYHVECKDHQRFKADSKRKNLLGSDTTIEYIHVLHKGAENSQNGQKNSKIERFQLFIAPEVRLVLSKDYIAPKTLQKKTYIAPKLVQKNENLDIKPEKVFEEKVIKSAFNTKITIKATDTQENTPIKETFKLHIIEEKKEKAANSDVIVSPMNYMGGKKKLLPFLLEKFPENVNKFVDLFCGGATVGVNAVCKSVILNDNLPYLTNMYRYFSENSAEDIINYIETTIKERKLDTENVDAYTELKKDYNAQLFKNPLDLFLLIAFGFNNQVRFNSRGEFNIPFGKNRSGWNPRMKKNLINFVNALHNKDVTFLEEDFADFDYSALTANDFVYVDPPYLASFATYNADWNETAEKRLLNILSELNSRGIRFALSNVLENNGKSNVILKKWVGQNDFTVTHLNISYANSAYCRKNKETKTDEVLITNY